MYEVVRFYQQIATPTVVATPTAAPGLNAATIAWISNVFAQSGVVVSDAQGLLINDLIVGLKADAIWDKLDRLFLFAVEAEDEGLNDLIQGGIATAVNSPTFTPDAGFDGGNPNSTKYIDCNVDLSLGGFNFVQDLADLIVWSNTAGVSGDDMAGGRPSFAINSIYPRYADDHIYYNITSTTEVASPATISDGSGLYVASRTASNASALFRNGSSLFTGTEASAAFSLTLPVYALRGCYGWSTGQCSAVGFGGGLSSTDQANLYARLRTYMTAVGVP